MEGDGEGGKGVEEGGLGGGEAGCIKEGGYSAGGGRGCRLVSAGVVLGAAADGDVLDEGAFRWGGEGVLGCWVVSPSFSRRICYS